MAMKCLRCGADAVTGKALCEECYKAHAGQVKSEESEAWVTQRLKETRRASNMRAEDKGSAKLNPFMVAGSLLVLAAFGLLFGVVLKGSSPSNQASPALTPEPEEEIVFE